MNPKESDDIIMIIPRRDQYSEEILSLVNNYFLEKKITIPDEKIAFKHSKGIRISSNDEILRINAAGNYSRIYFTNNEQLLVAKTLKQIESTLNEKIFIRIHQSHIININHIKSYKNGRYSKVELKSGIELPISRNFKKNLLNTIMINFNK